MKLWAVCWAVWAGTLIGCPAYRPGPYHPRAPAGGGGQPCGRLSVVSALLEESDAMVALGPSGPNLHRALACADAVLAKHPTHEEAAWRAARALFFLSFQAVPEQRAPLSARCMDVAQVAIGRGRRAESFYYAALCMGARAWARNLEGLELLPDMVEAGLAARRIDPTIAHAGPDRLLGGIYLRAPAWPTSVGDLDEALAHLRAAVAAAPAWPENHLLLAEALADDDQPEEARRVFARAMELMHLRQARGWLVFWEADVKRLHDRLSCH